MQPTTTQVTMGKHGDTLRVLKGYMALTILLFYTNVHHAQFYPTIDLNASWCMNWNDPIMGSRSHRYALYNNVDTTINDTAYQIMFDRSPNMTPYWLEQYFVRSSDDGKGYLRFPGSTGEFLVGDLGADVHDTVHDVLVIDRLENPFCGEPYSWKLVDFIVDSIITITRTNGYQSTRHYVSSDCRPVFANALYYWEENLGTPYGPCITWSDIPVYFPYWCVVNDTLVGGVGEDAEHPLGIPANDLCDLTVSLSFHSIGTSSHIRPNPTPGAITVELPTPLRRDTFYSVIDATGRRLYERPLPPGATAVDIDLSRFGTGTYILRITDPHGQRNERVVVE